MTNWLQKLTALGVCLAAPFACLRGAPANDKQDGRVTNYRITSPKPREVKIRINGESKSVKTVD